jgi:hypothetical protein
MRVVNHACSIALSFAFAHTQKKYNLEQRSLCAWWTFSQTLSTSINPSPTSFSLFTHNLPHSLSVKAIINHPKQPHPSPINHSLRTKITSHKLLRIPITRITLRHLRPIAFLAASIALVAVEAVYKHASTLAGFAFDRARAHAGGTVLFDGSGAVAEAGGGGGAHGGVWCSWGGRWWYEGEV